MTHDIEIELGINGTGKILVNGNNISNTVMGFNTDARPGEVPRIIFEMRSGYTIEGAMEVYYGTPTGSLGDLLCELLDSVDPQELEQEALRGLGWGDAENLTISLLNVLKRKVVENADQFGGRKA